MAEHAQSARLSARTGDAEPTAAELGILGQATNLGEDIDGQRTEGWAIHERVRFGSSR